MRALKTISAISARSRRPTMVVTSMLSISARASSGASTGVLPIVTVCEGPRTDLAGFTGITWPVTSQSNRWRTAASQPKIPHWFALNGEREPFAFAGIWRPWTGTRKGETGEHLLFAFLTTAPSDVVRPVHNKAMPVILTGNACDIWLEADVATALKLQQPWPADRLAVVATGQRQDTTPAAAA